MNRVYTQGQRVNILSARGSTELIIRSFTVRGEFFISWVGHVLPEICMSTAVLCGIPLASCVPFPTPTIHNECSRTDSASVDHNLSGNFRLLCDFGLLWLLMVCNLYLSQHFCSFFFISDCFCKANHFVLRFRSVKSVTLSSNPFGRDVPIFMGRFCPIYIQITQPNTPLEHENTTRHRLKRIIGTLCEKYNVLLLLYC